MLALPSSSMHTSNLAPRRSVLKPLYVFCTLTFRFVNSLSKISCKIFCVNCIPVSGCVITALNKKSSNKFNSSSFLLCIHILLSDDSKEDRLCSFSPCRSSLPYFYFRIWGFDNRTVKDFPRYVILIYQIYLYVSIDRQQIL